MIEPASRVPVDAVLECLRQICARHTSKIESNANTDAEVVAVTLEERQRFSGLLREAFRVSNGLLVDATVCGEGVRLVSDEGKLSALDAAVDAVLISLNQVDPGSDLERRIEGSTVAIAGSVSYDSVNAAQRSTRELLASLYHPDLRGAPLAGLIWADDELDDQHRRIIWPLLMNLPALLDRSPDSTIVLFGGDMHLDFNLHCTGNPSISGRITTFGYERRRAFPANTESVKDISRLSAEEAPLVVLFLGAGASTIEGLPTGNQLRNEALARQVGIPVVDQSNFVESAQKFFQQLRTGERLRPGEASAGEEAFIADLTLERVLLEEQFQENRMDCATVRRFASDHAAIADALADAASAGKFASDPLVNLLQMQRRFVLVTVNFDRIIEVKAGAAVKPYVEESEFDLLDDYLRTYSKDGGAVPLIKLHGDIERPQSIVVNIDETASGLSVARLNALEAIVKVVKEQPVHPWWFIGYSMRDLDLEAHWQSAAFADVMVEHWVAPFVDPAVKQFVDSHRQGRWTRKGFGYNLENRVVTLTARDFFECLWKQASSSW